MFVKLTTFLLVLFIISSLNPLTAAEIVYRSHYVISGRYHGYLLAKAFGVPFDTYIFNYKRIVDQESRFDHSQAYTQIKFLQHFLKKNRALLLPPVSWTDAQRNHFINQGQSENPTFSLSYLQSMDNLSLYRLLAFGEVS